MSALPLFMPASIAPIERVPAVLIAGSHRLRPTVAFASYWYFAAERQAMLFRRLRGDASLTIDPIIRAHRFTNAYRAADRVSQFLINTVIPGSNGTPQDLVFRVLLFKIFNSVDTWNALGQGLREPIHVEGFSLQRYDEILTKIAASGGRLYSNAYIMPNPPFEYKFKHTNHLALLSMLIGASFYERVLEARGLSDLYQLLKSVPSFGPFLAFQYAIDLNYSEILRFSEDEYVVAGPGAVSGVQKCFSDVDGLSASDVIRYMADSADQHFSELGLTFIPLWGRPLQLIDCQNLFCEVDKYSRVAHPQLSGDGGRSRIKQRYVPSTAPLGAFGFPKRWNIDVSFLPNDLPSISS